MPGGMPGAMPGRGMPRGMPGGMPGMGGGPGGMDMEALMKQVRLVGVFGQLSLRFLFFSHCFLPTFVAFCFVS